MIRSADLDATLERAFGLAFFLQGDREIALRIVTAAMEKLEVAASAQHKRLYYRPASRRPMPGIFRNRVSLSEPHLLQRLIFIESEPYERLREGAGLEPAGWVVHYLKHLVRITLKRNSFYVSLGISRLLFSYTTAEAMGIYQTLVQDPERVKSDYYYRSRKATLIQELKDRFGDLLRVSRAAHGEERFEPEADQAALAGVVEESLCAFTPWNTPCSVPARWDAFAEGVPSLASSARKAEDEVEIHRIHATLHPDCFRRLTAALGLDSPESRLRIPRFFVSGGAGQGGRRSPPPLDGEGLQRIKDQLAEQSQRRRRASFQLLRVLVDGGERARLSARNPDRVRFRLERGAELVEVRAHDGEGEITLATYLLGGRGDEPDVDLPAASIALENGGEILFLVTGEDVEVRHRPAGLIRWIRWLARGADRRLAPRLVPALAFLLLVLSLAATVLFFRSREPSGTQAPPPLKARATPAPAPAVPSPPVSPPRQEVAAHTPPRETGGVEDDVLRSLPSPDGVSSLSEVRQVCVEAAGDAAAGREIAGGLAKRLNAASGLRLTDNPDEAEACLKLAIERAGGERPLTVRVRLVNAGGRLLWPDRAGRTYEGSAEEIAAAIADDLLADYRGSP